MNMDFKKPGPFDDKSSKKHGQQGKIYPDKTEGKSNLILRMDVNTFDRMANNEFGGLRAFLTGKLSFKGNILLAQKFEREIVDVYGKAPGEKKFGGKL